MSRTDGYAPIRDYAAIGDGRTCALVARDGSIDWLCLPDVDSGAVFSRILDAERGGSFRLEPVEPFESEQRYRDGSNVLETTFRTGSGTVLVTDGMTFAHRDRLSPLRELVRKVEGISGRVAMRWSLEPRFDFGRARVHTGRRDGRAVFQSRQGAVAVSVFDAGDTQWRDGYAGGEFSLEEGRSALLDLTFAHRGPLVLPGREDAERELDRTDRAWREWSARAEYEGPYRDAVVRSALALKLLVYSPSGAIVAAPTTSLPERIGGGRNWDYRYSWLRDAVWALDVMLGLGYHDEATAFFWWFMHASRLTQPKLNVLYRVNGDTRATERELAGLDGYRGSSPVRTGNGALKQLQLDVYGSVLDSIARYCDAGLHIDKDTAKEIAEIADEVVKIWQQPDAGIWEPRSGPFQHIHSKAMCWVALHRAARLAGKGVIPDRRSRWEPAAHEVRRFWEDRGWSDELRSYVRAVELPEADASLLTLFVLDCEVEQDRMQGTIDRVMRDLRDGPFVYRYRGDDGLEPEEGAFVACSFWLACALAKAGRRSEAESLMEELLDTGNHVGLYSEEIDPRTHEFLGNFPQGLSHLALVNAAKALE